MSHAMTDVLLIVVHLQGIALGFWACWYTGLARRKNT